MLMACTVAHRFTIVSVLPRVKPMLEDMVRLHGLKVCASIRTTPLTVLDCERDPEAAKREIVVAARPRSTRTALRRSASDAQAWGRSTRP